MLALALAFVAAVLCGPGMGPGKGGAKGGAKGAKEFDIKEHLVGNFTLNVTKGLHGESSKTYLCPAVLHEDKVTCAMELVSYTREESTDESGEVIVEMKKTVLETLPVELVIRSKTAVTAYADGKELATVNFTTNEATRKIQASGVLGGGAQFLAVVLNANAFQVVVESAAPGKAGEILVLDAAREAKKATQPVWLKFLSPAMMVFSMFMSNRMKKNMMPKEPAAAPAAPAAPGADIPVEDEPTDEASKKKAAEDKKEE